MKGRGERTLLAGKGEKKETRCPARRCGRRRKKKGLDVQGGEKKPVSGLPLRERGRRESCLLHTVPRKGERGR